MRALTWQGNEHVEVTDVPDPAIQEPNDIIIRVTSTAVCIDGEHAVSDLPGADSSACLGHDSSVPTACRLLVLPRPASLMHRDGPVKWPPYVPPS